MNPRLAIPRAIRVRPAPPCDPPYDDERPPEDIWTVPVQPLWELAPPPPAPKATTNRPAPAPIPADVRTTAARVVHTCLEVINGLRPVAQLRALADPLEAHTVVSTMTRATRRLRREARPHRAGGGSVKIRLRRMRVCQPHADAIEVAAVVGTRERTWAVALRLQRRNGRWWCVAADVL